MLFYCHNQLILALTNKKKTREDISGSKKRILQFFNQNLHIITIDNIYAKH